MKNDSDSIEYNLTGKSVAFIYVYYFLILITSLSLSIYIICFNFKNIDTYSTIVRTNIVSLSVSSMLCCVEYIHKLYKACIYNRLKINDSMNIKCWGNLIYFISRPIFAAVFAFVMIIVFLSGIYVVTGNYETVINEKFLYVCVVSSTFIGVSIGNILDRFRSISKKKIDEFIDKNNKF